MRPKIRKLEERFIGASANPSYKFRNNNSSSMNLLLVGNNFLFSQRLNEILKRNHSMIDIAANPFVNQDGFIEFEIDSPNVVNGLIRYRAIKTVIITSEILFYNNSYKFFKKFSQIIKEIKKSNIKLVLILVEDPLLVRESRNDSTHVTYGVHDFYKKSLKKLKELVNPQHDLIFEFSSFYGYCESNWEINPVRWFSDYSSTKLSQNDLSRKIKPVFTDDLVKFIEERLIKTGIYKIGSEFNQISLETFIKYIVDVDKLDLSEDIDAIDSNVDSGLQNVENILDKSIDESKRGLSILYYQTQCSFSIIYRKKPSEFSDKFKSLTSVADIRLKLGALSAATIPENIQSQLDCIIPIPESGKYYAQGLAASLNKPYLEAFFKKKSIGRSFDINNSDLRREFIWSKLGLIPDLVDGKTIAIVDEAIITGATLRIACEMLNTSNVKGIYIVIPTPESKFKCNYNMQPQRTTLLDYVRTSSLASYFGVDGIFFQTHANFSESMKNANHLCTKCFTG